MMKKLFNRKGFSLAELLIVVAIIVVLMGVGFVSIITHLRNLQQVENDGQAKEIFVAAQNHLAMAESQGYLGLSDDKFGDEETDNEGVYYFVLGSDKSALNNSVLSQMLPAASVSEEARAGGSYIIRYQKDPAVILDVFYVSTSGRYSHTFAKGEYADVMKDYADHNGADHKADRKNAEVGSDTGVVLGYYGGVEAMQLEKGEPLEAPTIQIVNEDVLKVLVTNPNTTSNSGKNALNLVITGASSGAQKTFTIYDGGGVPTATSAEPRLSHSGYTATLILDDLSQDSAGFHFADLGKGENGKTFIPGEDIQIKAVAFNNNLITNIAESGTYTTNSLYAACADGTAEIAYFRHLMNLDNNVSGLNKVKPESGSWTDRATTDAGYITLSTAKQTADLDWTSFPWSGSEHKINPLIGSLSAANSYRPTDVTYTLAYNGGGHKISNVTVSGAANAGLFGSYTGGTISDLELVDFNLSGSSTAGALVGTATGTEISFVLVHDAENTPAKTITSAGASGGLAGSLTDAEVNFCAAAVYVRSTGSTGSNAGGLVGSAAGTTEISNSYSGGFTNEAKYEKESNSTIAPVNVSASSGTAGGLVGSAAGTTAIANSYSTSSVLGVIAGGFAGNTAADTTIDNCYAVGKVYKSDSATNVNHFVGVSSGTVSGQSYYLNGVSSEIPDQKITNLTAVSAGDTVSSDFILAESARKKAVAYDKVLLVDYEGKYYFPTVVQLYNNNTAFNSLVYTHCGVADENDPLVKWVKSFTECHYGDWQIPSLEKLNYKLLNGDALELQMELRSGTKLVTMAVKGLTSGVIRTYLIEVVRNTETNAVTGLTLKKEGYVASGAITGLTDPSAATVAAFNCRTPSITAKTVGTETRYDVKFALDDITLFGGQFVRLFANDDVDDDTQVLIPGENITVYLGGGDCAWSELNELPASISGMPTEDQTAYNASSDPNYNYCPKTANSLFANVPDTSDKTVMTTAGIELIRHLQNLDTSVSGVSGVTTANLENNIIWNATTYAKIYLKTATSATAPANTHVTGTFNGIYNTELTAFNGNSHQLTNFAIEESYGEADTGSGNAGLFRMVNSASTFTVSNLALLRPQIETESGHAGAVIAEVASGAVTLNNVKVHTGNATGTREAKVSATGSYHAGGLIGCVDPPSGKTASATLTDPQLNAIYSTSTGTVTVSSDNGSAGGLIGYANSRASSLTITNASVRAKLDGNDAAGSLTIEATGTGNAGGLVGESACNLTVKNPATDNNTVRLGASLEALEVSSVSGSAGGAVGKSSGILSLTSVLAKGDKEYGVTGGANAGGLVGECSSRVTITDSAAVLLVKAGSAAGGFVGSKQGEGVITIDKSYVGGHTTEGKYYVKTASDGGSDGRWNVIGGTNAGGLIGEFAGSAMITKSFSTASVHGATAGGIVGRAAGTFASGSLDLVYTVAPVYNVNIAGSGGNGALVGYNSTAFAAPNFFYLPDIYSELSGYDYDADTPSCSVAAVGSGAAISGVKYAAYYPEKDEHDNYIGDSAVLLGVSNPDLLEQSTSAYDHTLTAPEGDTNKRKEYPFTMWTDLDPRQPTEDETRTDYHFYGDWQPANDEQSTLFTFHFVRYIPDGAYEANKLGAARQLYVQLSPFKDDLKLTIPTLPYISGYGYGNKEDETLNTGNYVRLANSSSSWVWLMFYGDQTAALPTFDPATVTKYAAIGNYIVLEKADLEAAHKLSGSNKNVITLVAYYYPMAGQHTVTFKDYDPSDASSSYETFGNIQIIQDQKTVTDGVTIYTPNTVQKAIDDGQLRARKRNRPGYRFLGWYASADADPAVDTPVLKYQDGGFTVKNNITIDRNIVLYAKYEKVQYNTILVDFLLKNSTAILAPTYTLQYEKGDSFKMTLPVPSGLTVDRITLTSSYDGPQPLETEAKSTAEGIEINYPGTESPRHYYIHVTTTTANKEYFVRYVMEKTKAKTGYSYDDVTLANFASTTEYDSTNSFMFDPYADRTLETPEGTVPDVALFTQSITGYIVSGSVQKTKTVPVTASNYETYHLTADKVGSYVVQVTYERDVPLLTFVTSVGDEQGDYIPPEYLSVGTPLRNLLTQDDYKPGRSGYAFNGWDYVIDGEKRTIPASGETAEVMPPYALTLTAKWTPVTVNYTVLIWVENPDDNGYTQMGSQVITNGAYANEVICVDEAANGTVVVYTEKLPEGQSIDLAAAVDKVVSGETVQLSPYIQYDHSDEGVRANGRGTTKINVYFNRKIYRLRFDVGYGIPKAGSGTTSYVAIGEGENYSGTVYGLVNGSHVPLTGDGTNWFTPGAENNPNSKPYALVDGQYVELTKHEETKYYYKPQNTYTKDMAHSGTRFGLVGDASFREFLELERTSTTPDAPNPTYKLTQFTTETHTESGNNTSYYALVDGVYHQATKDNRNWKYYTYTAVGDDDAENNRYGLIDLPDGKQAFYPITRTGDRGNRYYILPSGEVYKGTRYKRDRNTTNFSSEPSGRIKISYTDVDQEYLSTDRYSMYTNTNNPGFYLDENGRYGKVGNLYVVLSSGTTPDPVYSYTVIATNAEYDISLDRFRQNNAYNGDTKYLETDSTHVVMHNGVRYIYDDGAFGNAGTYLLAGDRIPVTEVTYQDANGTAHTPTWLNPYTGDLYKQIQTREYSSYSIGNSTNSDTYGTDKQRKDNFINDGKVISGLSEGESPFILTTEKIYSPGYYHGTYDYTYNRTTYTIFYWDVVAKYGANIYNMWPNELEEQTSNRTTYRFIGFLANRYSNYCTTNSTSSIKGKIDCMTDLIIKTRDSSSGSFTAQAVTVNPDGTYGNQVAHELFCRYSAGQTTTTDGNNPFQKYLYRYEVKDPNKTNKYNVIYETLVRSQRGHPYRQNAGDLSGYVLVETMLIDSKGDAHDPSNMQSNRDYLQYKFNIPLELPPNGNIEDGSGVNSNSDEYGGVLMRFRYEPIEYKLSFEYTGDLVGTITTLNGSGVVNGVAANIPYTQNLSDYAFSTITGLDLDEYDWDGNWYDNAACSSEIGPFFKAGDTTFNSTRTMPTGELTLYANVTHKPVQVTFNLAGGTMGGASSFSQAWGETLEQKINTTGGIENYTPVREGYTFKGWYVGETRFALMSRRVEGDILVGNTLTLTAKWEQDESTTASVTVYYILDPTNSNSGVSNDPTDYTTFLASGEGTTWWKETVQNQTAGRSYTVQAPTSVDDTRLTNYYPVSASRSCILQGGTEQDHNYLVFVYHQPTKWYYEIEYRLLYKNVEEKAGWDYSDSGVNMSSSAFSYVTVTTGETGVVHETTDQFKLIGYDPKITDTTTAPWLSQYKLYGFADESTAMPTEAPYYLLESSEGTSSTAPKKVYVYLLPDPDAIEIEDRVETYNGETHLRPFYSYPTYSDKAPVWFNDATTQLKVYYLYYDLTETNLAPDNNLTQDKQVVDAKTYGVRAYLTATVTDATGTKTFVIWQSEDDQNGKPPLHLYVERRIVFLYSGFAKDGKEQRSNAAIQGYDGSVLTYHVVECEPGTATEAQYQIQQIITGLTAATGFDPADSGFVQRTVYNDDGTPKLDDDGNVIKVNDKDGVSFVFAANAFRRMKGVSPNVFTYVLDETKINPKNYDFYVCYGQLNMTTG